MASLEIESTLTDRYQTTVPDAVRRTLKLRKRDKIRYVVRPDGAVLLTRADAVAATDPVVEKFLAFLARDMEQDPDSNSRHQRSPAAPCPITRERDQGRPRLALKTEDE